MYDIASERVGSYYADLLWGDQVNVFTALWVMELDVGFDPQSLRELLLHRNSPMQLDKRARSARSLPADRLMVIPQLMALAQEFRSAGLFQLVPNSKGNYVAYEQTEMGRQAYYEGLEMRINLAIEAPDVSPAFICQAVNQSFLSAHARRKSLFDNDKYSYRAPTPAGVVNLQTFWFGQLMLPLFCGVLSSLLTRFFCAVPRTSVSRIAWG